MIDPRDSNRGLLAIERRGGMASADGASNWTASKQGYAHRYVYAILADHKDASTLYVGVVNDREFGGVFYSHDAGQHWLQKAAGLGGKDVFALKQAPSGMLVAGTNHGMFSLEHNASEWHPINAVVVEHTLKTAGKGKGSRKTATKTTFEKSQLESRVNDLELGSGRWLAATTTGIYSSTDQGKTWKAGRILGHPDSVSIRAEGSTQAPAPRSP